MIFTISITGQTTSCQVQVEVEHPSALYVQLPDLISELDEQIGRYLKSKEYAKGEK